MKTYEINKTFASYEECENWKEKNCPDRTYNGEMILMVSHETNTDGTTTITSITTI